MFIKCSNSPSSVKVVFASQISTIDFGGLPLLTDFCTGQLKRLSSVFIIRFKNYMQKSFFPVAYQSEEIYSRLDWQRRNLERAEYTTWYCVREIIYEQYLWDMRCWHKPKFQYSKAEVMEQIKKWIQDHAEGNWTNNCGHCLFCIKKLLYTKACSLEQIANYCLQNKFIKYSKQINTWQNGFAETSQADETTRQINSSEKGEKIYV